jgi:hypothetical protein
MALLRVNQQPVGTVNATGCWIVMIGGIGDRSGLLSPVAKKIGHRALDNAPSMG